MASTHQPHQTSLHTSSLSCKYCLQSRPHPLFCYLLSDSRCTPSLSNHRLVAYIGLTRHPFLRLLSHNRSKGFRPGTKCTKSGSNFWQLELIIGPFYHSAKKFKLEWRRSSRKIFSRIRQGYLLARKYRIRNLYARDRNLVYSLVRSKGRQ